MRIRFLSAALGVWLLVSLRIIGPVSADPLPDDI